MTEMKLNRPMAFNNQIAPLARTGAGLCTLLVASNMVCWLWAFVAFRESPLLIGTAALAYSFGLRHALDADHIAAIDNMTRKLMQQGERPTTVGLYFALGHSTIVVVLSIMIAISSAALQTRFETLKAIGALLGTFASSLFLFAIAFVNILTLISIYRTFNAVKKGQHFIEEDLNVALSNRGVLGRLYRSCFRVIKRSRQMYPLGLLFGLGFDTATEVGLLIISATQASQGLPIWTILTFPALFTAGMTLVDTLDGILMVGAYGWAFIKPIRKLYYNLVMTAVSVLVAVAVGGLEVLNLIGDRFGLTDSGGFWGMIGAVNDNPTALGGLIVVLFLMTWAVSYGIYSLKDYDRVNALVKAPH